MGNSQFKLNDDTKSTELGVSAGLSIPNFLMIPDRIFKSNLPRTEIGLHIIIKAGRNLPEILSRLITAITGRCERFFTDSIRFS